ncbi:MAG: MFS transporter [Rikenellaceae bacterium]|nr:MFS transporter [Rikenellaceae bacterium]
MQRRIYAVVALIMVFWFIISFITNIIGPLIPDIIDNFRLSHLAVAAFIPTSFFIAYGIMAIPAGILIERWSEKGVLAVGFLLPLAGSLIFALMPSFPVLLASSFTIGLGMAMLQTVINPLMRVAGGEENFAFVSVMGQLVFGAASFISPLVYSKLVTGLGPGGNPSGLTALLGRITPEGLPWVSLYWLFSFILIAAVVVVLVVRFPRITLKEEEKTGGAGAFRQLLANKYVYIFFFGIFAYVATEQGIVNWMSEFLREYHGFDPQREGARAVGYFWGFMSVGCLVGLVALRLWDSRKVLMVSGASSLALLAAGVFGTGMVSFWSLALTGFTISVMYSIIISLGLNSVSRHHGALAGILVAGIVGGAVGPLAVGAVGDAAGLRLALLLVAVPIVYIIWIAFTARPLVNNKTVEFSGMFGKNEGGGK